MADSPAQPDNNVSVKAGMTVSQAAASLLEGFLSEEENPKPDEEQTETPKKKAGAEVETEDSEVEELEEVDPDAEDEETEDPPAPRKHKFKSGDEEIEVDEPELYGGYLRRKDYTQKTQAVAEEKKAVAAEKEAVAAQNVQAAEKLKTIEDALKAMTPAEPDWNKLRREMKPEQFAGAYIEWQEHMKRIAVVENARKDADDKVVADRKGKMAEFVKAEHAKLLDAVPEFKDEAKLRTGMAKLAQFAIKELGFTREELGTVTDHRIIKLFRLAQQKHELTVNRPDPKKQAVRTEKTVAAPTGGDPSKTKVSKSTRALQSHAKLRSVASAAAAIEEML